VPELGSLRLVSNPTVMAKEGAELVTLDAGLRSRYPSVDVTRLQ
jgi:hypothetical protein